MTTEPVLRPYQMPSSGGQCPTGHGRQGEVESFDLTVAASKNEWVAEVIKHASTLVKAKEFVAAVRQRGNRLMKTHCAVTLAMRAGVAVASASSTQLGAQETIIAHEFHVNEQGSFLIKTLKEIAKARI